MLTVKKEMTIFFLPMRQSLAHELRQQTHGVKSDVRTLNDRYAT